MTVPPADKCHVCGKPPGEAHTAQTRAAHHEHYMRHGHSLMCAAHQPQIPAERVRPGVRVQRINVFNRDGHFDRQATMRGTEEKVRLHFQLLGMHPTDPGFAELHARYLAIPA